MPANLPERKASLKMSANPGEESLPWKQIVEQAVHDMRTPLSCMRTTVEILRMISADSEPHGKMVGSLNLQIDELASHMESLLKNPVSFTKRPPPLMETPGMGSRDIA
jgi:K+-sensing histidine kinase KdpD